MSIRKKADTLLYTLPRFWHFLWSASYTKLKKVDPATKEITVTKPIHYGFSKGKPFRIENAISELDQPGEWYLNYTTKTLLFFPPKSKPAPTAKSIDVSSKPAPPQKISNY